MTIRSCARTPNPRTRRTPTSSSAELRSHVVPFSRQFRGGSSYPRPDGPRRSLARSRRRASDGRPARFGAERLGGSADPYIELLHCFTSVACGPCEREHRTDTKGGRPKMRHAPTRLIAAALKPAKAAIYLALGSTACAVLLPAAAPAEVATGGSTSFSVCDPLGTPSLLSPQATVAGRGGPVREPDLGQAHDDLPASAKGQADAGFSTTVSVYVHVVTDGPIGALTDSDISAQLRVLNRTFAGPRVVRRPASRSSSRASRGPTTRTGSTPALAESTRTR
jgi:hypothetical protein